MNCQCSFCGKDPYDYVDAGVGEIPAAVTCCDLGIALYSRRSGDSDNETVEVPIATLRSIARVLDAMRCLGMEPEIEI